MTFVRTFVSIGTLTSADLTTSTWAAAGNQHDVHHPAAITDIQVAQAQPGMGMRAGATAPAPAPGYADQMKAMQQMHDKTLAAKTPEEHNALMAEQMKLMQTSMKVMGGMAGAGGAGIGMGPAAAAG